MARLGLELGIRAPTEAVVKAHELTESENLDYYFVPETIPKIMGVDAFDALEKISKKSQVTTLGTAVVSVYSRSLKLMEKKSTQIYDETNHNFVLGIGTSIEKFAEINNEKFDRPLERMRLYTEKIKQNDVPVYWAAVGDKMISSAAEQADGIIFFMKPSSEIRCSLETLKKSLYQFRKLYDLFEVGNIIPVFVDNDTERAKKHAKITVANYVIGNKFYRHGLIRGGFEKEVPEIIKYHNGLDGWEKVSDNMINSLCAYGAPDICSWNLRMRQERNGVKAIVAGFDSSKDGYNENFFHNMKKFLKYFSG